MVYEVNAGLICPLLLNRQQGCPCWRYRFAPGSPSLVDADHRAKPLIDQPLIGNDQSPEEQISAHYKTKREHELSLGKASASCYRPMPATASSTVALPSNKVQHIASRSCTPKALDINANSPPA